MAFQHSQRIPLYKWVIGPLVLAYYTFILNLQLYSMLNRVTIYCPTLWTRELYYLISMFKSNLGSFTTRLIINMGCNHTQPSLDNHTIFTSLKEF